MPLVIFGSSERGDERHPTTLVGLQMQSAPRVDFSSWPKPRRFLVADFSTFRGNTCARGWSGNVVRTATRRVMYSMILMCCHVLWWSPYYDFFLKISSEQFSRKVAGKSVWFQLQISSRCNRQPALASAPRLAGPRFWYTSWGAEVSTNQPPTFPKRRCGATVILNICSGRATLWRDSCDLLRGHGSHEGSCQDVAGSHCPHCPWLKSTWAWHITVIPKCQQNPKNTNHRHHHHYPLVI